MSDKLSIAWWNTSISPSSCLNRMDNKQYNFALSVIGKTIYDYNIDLFCLGEVSGKNILDLSEMLKNDLYEIYDGCFKSDKCKIKHDMCIIYNSEKLMLLTSTDIARQTHLGAIRAGIELKFYHLKTEQMFIILIICL